MKLSPLSECRKVNFKSILNELSSNKNSLFTYLISRILLLLIVSVAVIAVMLIREDNISLQNHIFSEAQGQVKILAQGSREALLTDNYDLLEGWLTSASTSDNFAYAFITDVKGVILVHSRPEYVNKSVEPTSSTTEDGKLKQYEGVDVIELRHPIIVGNKKIGVAYVSFYRDVIGNHNYRSFHSLFWLSVVLIMTVVFSFYYICLLIRYVTKPLNLLTNTINKTSIKKYLNIDSKLLTREDEIGSLSRSFKNINTELVNAFHELENKNIELEGKVTRRTLQLKNALLDMEQVALIDQLTGAYNRRKFNEIIENEINRSKRKHEYLSILFLDVDHFKKINDAYGHAVGDRVLKKLVELIKKKIRIVDHVFRWGGEEFLVLLPDTKIDDAVSSAERIRTTIASYQFDTVVNVRVSIGATEQTEHDTINDLLNYADCALYQAKRNGRNRTIQYSADFKNKANKV